MAEKTDHAEDELPDDLAQELAEKGITVRDEVALRRELERRVAGYNLFRLTPAAVRRWKTRYRVLLDAGYYDGQSAMEAYGRALSAVLHAASDATPTPEDR